MLFFMFDLRSTSNHVLLKYRFKMRYRIRHIYIMWLLHVWSLFLIWLWLSSMDHDSNISKYAQVHVVGFRWGEMRERERDYWNPAFLWFKYEKNLQLLPQHGKFNLTTTIGSFQNLMRQASFIPRSSYWVGFHTLVVDHKNVGDSGLNCSWHQGWYKVPKFIKMHPPTLKG